MSECAFYPLGQDGIGSSMDVLNMMCIRYLIVDIKSFQVLYNFENLQLPNVTNEYE